MEAESSDPPDTTLWRAYQAVIHPNHELSPMNRLLLLLVLVECEVGRTYGVELTVAQIAECMGVCERTAQLAIRSMAQAKWLEVKARSTKGGKRLPSRYRVTPQGFPG